MAAGITPTYTVQAGNPTNEETGSILNYNEQMEYRRGGKTNLMFSAACLGGHWKRVNTVVPDLFQGGSWLSAKLDSKEFEQNRYDVVTRCMERGMNYIDACTMQEVIMYAKALKGRRDKMYLGFSWYQGEMRSLSREMGEDMGDEFNEVVDRLEKGEAPESIEESMPDLGAGGDEMF